MNMNLKAHLKHHFLALGIIVATFGIYFFTLFPRMIVLQPSGLYLGHEHVWSDWPLHISMIHTFATRSPENWFAHHPMYAHGKFTYSFLTNFVSAIFMRAGFSLEQAIIIPSLLYISALLIGLYTLIYLLFKSRVIAVLAIFLFFLSSGPGFIEYINDIIDSPTAETILYPSKHYSRINEYSWYAGNVIVGMIVPQRAFLFGITVGVWVLTGLVYALQHLASRHAKTILICSGIGAGILTVGHIHSLITLVIVTGSICVAHYKHWRQLLYYVVPAGIISIALYTVFIAGGIESKQFITLQPGYTAKGSLIDWLVMWYRLWGLMIPTAIAGFFLLHKKQHLSKSMLIGFTIVFLIANLVLFQPVEWDNAKFFGWVYLGFSISAAYFLVTQFKHIHKYQILLKGSVIIITLFLTLTGTIELLRLQYVEKNAFMGISADDMKLGRQVRAQTDETAIFLTSTSTNHWAMVWAARPIMMGFVGWVNNFGFLYEERLEDIKTIYAGGEQILPLLQKYDISYVVIGPGELHEFNANEEYFRQTFPIKFQNQSNRVYDVRM